MENSTKLQPNLKNLITELNRSQKDYFSSLLENGRAGKIMLLRELSDWGKMLVRLYKLKEEPWLKEKIIKLNNYIYEEKQKL